MLNDDSSLSLSQAFEQVLRHLEQPNRQDMQQTPERVAKLWKDVLLAGTSIDPRAVVKRSRQPTVSSDPILIRHIAIHMVCPHHLTIATGHIDIAYIPDTSILGFGALETLARAATARFTLQEEAGARLVAILEEHLGVLAAVCQIVASHPCQQLIGSAARQAKIETWHQRGDPKGCERLSQRLMGT